MNNNNWQWNAPFATLDNSIGTLYLARFLGDFCLSSRTILPLFPIRCLPTCTRLYAGMGCSFLPSAGNYLMSYNSGLMAHLTVTHPPHTQGNKTWMMTIKNQTKTTTYPVTDFLLGYKSQRVEWGGGNKLGILYKWAHDCNWGKGVVVVESEVEECAF